MLAGDLKGPLTRVELRGFEPLTPSMRTRHGRPKRAPSLASYRNGQAFRAASAPATTWLAAFSLRPGLQRDRDC